MGLFSSFFKGKSGKKQLKEDEEDKEARKRAYELLSDAKDALLRAHGMTNIDKDMLENYCAKVAALQAYLSNTPVLRLDSSEIDTEIKKSATLFAHAIRDDMALAAEKGFDALRWGILEGRKDLYPAEVQNTREIMDNRLRIMNTYIAMQYSAAEADKSRAVQIKLNAEKDKVAAEVKSCNDYLKAPENVVTMNIIKGKKLLNPQFTGDTEVEKRFILNELKLSAYKRNLAQIEKEILNNERVLTDAESAVNTAKMAILKLETQQIRT